MRTTILAILASVALAMPFSTYAKGGSSRCYGTPAECQAQAEQRQARQDEAEQKLQQEEKAEQAKVTKAVAAGLEQVKELYATEREINAWLRANPTAKIVRVIPVVSRHDEMVLIFYKKGTKK